MTFEIINRQINSNGEVFTIKIQEETIRILFLFHAIKRIIKWDIQEEMAAETLLLPDEVIVGHRNRYIAQRRYSNHVVRAVYEYVDGFPVLVTLYFPSEHRYFRGGGIYEDKIFKGS
ncbi:MAG: DUF4258 domain-containing protein [Nitrospirae bacterium YQR-1]